MGLVNIHLFRRKGFSNWYARFQFAGSTIIKSLKTDCFGQALKLKRNVFKIFTKSLVDRDVMEDIGLSDEELIKKQTKAKKKASNKRHIDKKKSEFEQALSLLTPEQRMAYYEDYEQFKQLSYLKDSFKPKMTDDQITQMILINRFGSLENIASIDRQISSINIEI